MLRATNIPKNLRDRHNDVDHRVDDVDSHADIEHVNCDENTKPHINTVRTEHGTQFEISIPHTIWYRAKGST